jgi:hypothetical protein
MIMLIDAGNNWMYRPIRVLTGFVMAAWLVAYLPLALRRVYGGSWPMTLLKVSGLGVLYLIVMFVAMIGATIVALARF